MVHRSDSSEQLNAESIVRRKVSAIVGVELSPQSLQLDGKARVDVDGAALDQSVLVEIFAHQGRLRGAQFHKVARDALKLITLRRTYPASRLVIAFCDAEAARCVEGGSWLAEALRVWRVDVVTVDLADATRAGLRDAQIRQVMVSPQET
jgi:hypothetical protein